MKITKNGLKQIIKEEVEKVINENFDGNTGLPNTVAGIGALRKDDLRFTKFMTQILAKMPDDLKFKFIRDNTQAGGEDNLVSKSIRNSKDSKILSLMKHLGFAVAEDVAPLSTFGGSVAKAAK